MKPMVHIVGGQKRSSTKKKKTLVNDVGSYYNENITYHHANRNKKNVQHELQRRSFEIIHTNDKKPEVMSAILTTPMVLARDNDLYDNDIDAKKR